MIVQKLLNLGWKAGEYFYENEPDFYLRRVFEISKSKELENYTSYVPKPDEKIFLAYELFPNRQTAHWCLWGDSDNPADAPWDFDDYETVLELALQDRLFTYPE